MRAAYTPCEQTVRALVRYRAAMRQASLDDDLKRCTDAGIQL